MTRSLFILFLLLAGCLGAARAQTPAASGTLPAAQPASGPALQYGPFGFPFSYTGEVLGNPVGGHRQGAVYDGLLKAGVTVNLGKWWPGATLTVDGLYPHGSSLTRNDVRDFGVLSNIDTVHNPRLYDAWIEQSLDDGKFSIRAGQVPIDTEFCNTTSGAIYIHSNFGAMPIISANFNVAVYPIAAPGIRFKAAPNDSWTVRAGVFDGNDGDLNSTDRNGLRYNLNGRDGAFFIAEAAYTLNPPPAPGGDGKQPAARPLSGTYTLGGFYDTGDISNGTLGGPRRGNGGFYVMADQEVWHVPGAPDRGLRAFARVGAAPEDRSVVDFYCDGGCNYTGPIPIRPQDVLGLAATYSSFSRQLRDASGDPFPNRSEAVIELTYQAIVTANFNVQPDMQVIVNPGALGVQPNAWVMGVRFNLTF